MGVVFNRPNYSGAAANQKKHNNMLQAINMFKRQNPNLQNPAPQIAQVPAFNGAKKEGNAEEEESKSAAQAAQPAPLVSSNSYMNNKGMMQ